MKAAGHFFAPTRKAGEIRLGFMIALRSLKISVRLIQKFSEEATMPSVITSGAGVAGSAGVGQISHGDICRAVPARIRLGTSRDVVTAVTAGVGSERIHCQR